MNIEAILVSNEVLGLAMLLMLSVFGYFNRSFLIEIWRDDERFWRIVTRLALASNLALLGWDRKPPVVHGDQRAESLPPGRYGGELDRVPDRGVPRISSQASLPPFLTLRP